MWFKKEMKVFKSNDFVVVVASSIKIQIEFSAVNVF